jgi:hypothetical protein
MRITRLLPLSGIAFVALVVLSIGVGGGTPDPAAPPQEVVSFYEDELIRQRLAAYVLAASMPFLLFFASQPRGLSLAWRSRRACRLASGLPRRQRHRGCDDRNWCAHPLGACERRRRRRDT